jgi:hypothetical protein
LLRSFVKKEKKKSGEKNLGTIYLYFGFWKVRMTVALLGEWFKLACSWTESKASGYRKMQMNEDVILLFEAMIQQ